MGKAHDGNTGMPAKVRNVYLLNTSQTGQHLGQVAQYNLLKKDSGPWSQMAP
jgi:hypothetical protein